MNADRPGARALSTDEAALAVEVFRMLADPTRVRLLWTLRHRELSVNELASQLDRPAAAISQHLAKLRMSRLVLTRRDGTSVFYRVANDHIEQLVVDAVHHAEHATSDSPRHHREATATSATVTPFPDSPPPPLRSV